MALTADAITHKKLVFIKQLYRHALSQSTGHPTPINRVLAVIEFDLSQETLIRLVVSLLDTSHPPEWDFHKLIKQANFALAQHSVSALPDRANIVRVHNLRNDAQHQAKTPNESDINDCRTYTRDFLQKSIHKVWGLDFEKISLTDIIQHVEVKNYLVQAEVAFNQGTYMETAKFAGAGLEWALARVESRMVGNPHSHVVDEFAMLDRSGKPDTYRTGKSVYRAFRQMQETVLYLALGIDYVAHVKYRKMGGRVDFGGNRTIWHAGIDTITAVDAEFVLDYCINTVIQIESVVGDIDRPLQF